MATRRELRISRRAERRARRGKPLGTVRWNARKGFYQVRRAVMTAFGFPLPMWVRVKNQEAAKGTMESGSATLKSFNRAVRSGMLGEVAPHVMEAVQLEEMLPDAEQPITADQIEAVSGASPKFDRQNYAIVTDDDEGPQIEQLYQAELPASATQALAPGAGKTFALGPKILTSAMPTGAPMHECPCPKLGEHDYEKNLGQDTGLRPLYRTTLSLAVAPAAVLFTMVVNDPGSIDRLYVGASDLATGANQAASVTITGSITLNSIPLDFAVAPSSTMVPWQIIRDRGLGMAIGRIDLVKNDNLNVPLLNGAAVVTKMEMVASLWGPCDHYRDYR